MGGTKYRFKQGIYALTAHRRPVDVQLAAQFLNQPQLTLFRRLPLMEQHHALAVLNGVLRAPLPAEDDRAVDDLAVAALLHDCGKMLYPVRVWQKTLPVLVNKASPRLFKWMAGHDPRRLVWRGFAVKAHHPAWGAGLVSETGASARVVWLVAHHQDPAEQWAGHPYSALLTALQAADDSN